jgi:hypothetical protein
MPTLSRSGSEMGRGPLPGHLKPSASGGEPLTPAQKWFVEELQKMPPLTPEEESFCYFAPCPHCLVVVDMRTVPTWGTGEMFSAHGCPTCCLPMPSHSPTFRFFADML